MSAMSFLCNTSAMDIIPRLASLAANIYFRATHQTILSVLAGGKSALQPNWYSHLDKSLAAFYKQQYLNLPKRKELLHIQSYRVCLGSISSVPRYITPKGHQQRVTKQKPSHSQDTIGHDIPLICSKCVLWIFTLSHLTSLIYHYPLVSKLQ